MQNRYRDITFFQFSRWQLDGGSLPSLDFQELFLNFWKSKMVDGCHNENRKMAILQKLSNWSPRNLERWCIRPHKPTDH